MSEEQESMVEYKPVVSPETPSEKSLESGGSRRHQCQQCDKSFSHSAGLYNHMRRKHGLVVYAKASIMCKEPNCEFRCSMRDKLQTHLVMEHQKPLAFSTLKFSSMKEFEEWKEVFEKQEKCRFVKKSGSRIRSNTGEKHTYLYCSRSGTFVSNSKGKRTQMKKGSCKISNYCTASIDCIEEQSGTVIAKLCSTHYGHEPSVEFLRLTKSDKSVIADKLAQGIPRDVVIDNVRASVGENLDRIHFLTMKDIRNIERSFGIKHDTKTKSSGIEGFESVNEWVNDMDNLGEESPVVFYKRKNAPKVLSDDCDCLEVTDFCLILMTKGQQEILQKFGQNGVFYLTWLSVNNGYDLSLLTLMVADDLNEAFPVAYMICSRTSKEIETLFFKVIRDKLSSICARAIMTDDRKSLYDSWCAVMGFVPYHLLSNRFVDADWRDRLITVQNEDVQCAVYEVLYSYLSCTDSTKFEENLEAFIKHLKENSDTLIFGLYFEDNYLHRVHLWAGCYDKKSVGVNEHLNLDIIYNELLNVCNLKGKYSRLLDKTLQGLLTIVRDRQHNRILKITKQIQELSHHHNISKNIDLDAIQVMENRKWQIKSETASFVFTVARKTYECSLKCALVCTECKMCAHMFECTCKVYNFDRTMCKHIHAIGRLHKKSLTVLDFWDSGSADKSNGKDISPDDMNKNATISDSSSDKKEDESSDEKDKSTEEDLTSKENNSSLSVKDSNKIIVAQKKRVGKDNPLFNKIRNILQGIADGVNDIREPHVLKKIFIKLKKIKNFMEVGPNVNDIVQSPVVKKRGRPKKIVVNDAKVEERSLPVKRKIGRPRKIIAQTDNHAEVRPRSLQEMAQEQLLEEMLHQDHSDEEEENESINKTSDCVSGSEGNASVKETKIPKKRGRKPKLKIEPNKSPSEPEHTEVPSEDVETGRRKSKRNIKKRDFAQYECYTSDKDDTPKRKTSRKLSINDEATTKEIKAKRVKTDPEDSKKCDTTVENDITEEESQADPKNENNHRNPLKSKTDESNAEHVKNGDVNQTEEKTTANNNNEVSKSDSPEAEK